MPLERSGHIVALACICCETSMVVETISHHGFCCNCKRLGLDGMGRLSEKLFEARLVVKKEKDDLLKGRRKDVAKGRKLLFKLSRNLVTRTARCLSRPTAAHCVLQVERGA